MGLRILLIVIGYMVGAIPVGIIIVRIFGGLDPRTVGSLNIGATNVRRTSGNLAGILTLAGDIFKGIIPTFLAYYLGWEPIYVSAVGLFAFLGHLYPVFLKFKGGKGVATACGVFLIISPISLFLSVLVLVFILLITRYVSLGSILAAIAMPVGLGVFDNDPIYVTLGVVIAFFIILKHSDNIKRLLKGEENKFKVS